MVQGSKVTHHLHLRKRIHSNLEKYPHPNKFKKYLDKIIYLVGVLGPILTIPQLTEIWISKNASGVSLISWSWYVISALIWLSYGIVHKEKPIIVTNILWTIINIFIVIGIILYG
jgi:uncharacterized protein with PQ loop repeat